MVSELVIKTLKKMYEQGTDDETVKGMLEDIGLGKDEISEAIAAAKGREAPSPVQKIEPIRASELKSNLPMLEPLSDESLEKLAEELPDSVSERAAQKIKEHLSEKNDEHELRDLMTHASLEQHGRAISDVKDKVDSLHRKISGIAPGEETGLDELRSEINEIKEKINDINAKTSAMQIIIKKLLEANQELLSRIRR